MLMVNENLFKNDELLHTLPFHEAMAHFQSYVSQSIDRVKTITNKPIHTVLIYIYIYIYIYISTFDTPILLRNAGKEFADKLQFQDVWFADSLTLFKALVKCKLPSLSNSDNTFPKTNQSSLYKA